MAKRDKLYTVNKWNKPFFEEERKRRLYPDGGFKPFVHENLGWKVFGYNDTSYNPIYNLSSLTKQNLTNPKSTSWNDYSGNDYTDTLTPVQKSVTTHAFSPEDIPAPKASINDSNKSKTSDILSTVNNALNGIKNTGLLGDGIIKNETLKSTLNPLKTPSLGDFKVSLPSLTANSVIPAANKLIYNGATTARDLTNHAMVDALSAKSLLKQGYVKDMATANGAATAAKDVAKSGISNLGKAGINIGASLLGKGAKSLLSNGLSTGIGEGIGTVADAASTVVLFIPGVGWVAAPIISFVGNALAGAWNGAFGHQTYDNGATAYTNKVNTINPNGSNEYIANLLANTGYGPQATYKDGWWTHKGRNEATKINDALDLALQRFRRGADNAINNNNWLQLMYAMNDNITAMGGKLNKCKCNKKSYGGYLDSATPTGFNFLSDLTNIQTQKNLNSLDMNTSIGNSFMGMSNMGTMLANGGPINIKKSHRGRLTELKKRTGKTEAELYNDGNPAHKKMVTFARNARKWKKAYGGFLDAADSLAQAENNLLKSNGGRLDIKDKNTGNYSFIPGASLYELGGTLQAAGSNWGNATVVEEGGTHELNPYEGVQVGVDPEGTPNLVEEGEVIWNDYVFSNRITVPKEVCKKLRIGQKKDGFTFAEAAKKLLVESKERPNDPISKNGLDANMQILEDTQEEVKQKMEAEQAVEQFNSLPPEQQVAIMNQEGERALDAVAQELMAQEFNNLPPEQQLAIAQQMAMEQAQAQGMPQGQPSPEEQAMMQQLMAQQQMPQGGINSEEALAQAAAMQQQAINGSAYGGKLCFGGIKFADGGSKDKKYINGAKSHWETNERGEKVLVPNTPFENTGFGGGQFGMAGGGVEWGEDPTPLMPKKRDWLAIDYKESFNKAYERARRQKKKTFWFNGKEYSTAYNPNLTKEEVEAGNNRYQTKGLIIAPWEHALGGRLFAEGGMIPQDEMATEGQYQQNEQPVEQADNEMAKYSDEELQDMIDDYQEAESGEVKVTKGKLARLRKKAEKAQAELERRHSQENEEQPQEARQEPSQEEIQAAAQALAQQQMMEGQPQEGMPLEGVSPEQAMMMLQLMGGGLMSPEQMAAAELQQLGEQYACGGKVNKYAYAGPLKPQPTSPFTEAQGAIYGKRPDIPQEVYDWFISLTPDERFDLFGGTDFWSTRLEDYNEDPNNWYNEYKKNPSSPNRRYWRAAVTNEESVNRDNSDWHTIVLDAYKNRRDSSGKYIPYNLSQDIIHWYANLPEDERKKIVANTKMKGKDFSTVVEYANKGAAGPVTEAIVNAYNAANGDSSTSTINSPDGQIVGGAQQTIPTSSIDYAPYFRGMTTNDIFGLIWDLMSSERRNGISRKDFIANNSNLPTNGWSSYNDELLNVYYNLHPEARNSGWTFDSNPYRTYANVDFHDATSTVGNNGNKMVAESFYANDPAWSQLTELQRQLKGNELAAALEATQAYKDFSRYLRDNRTSQYVKDYFTKLADRGSKIAKNALADWDNMTASKFDAVIKNLREDAAAPPNSPGNKNNNALGLGHFTPAFAESWTNRYWIKDKDGNYSQVIGGIADADKDKYIAINTNPYQVTVGDNNYNDYYYRPKTDAEYTADIANDEEGNYLTVGWKPKTNWTDYTLGMLPGLTGLTFQIAQGKPDTSGLDAAAAFADRYAGIMVPPHLTHGLMTPAIIDPRITRNTANASRLGVNRMLRNTGSAPSQAASILANDTNYQHQMGQNDLRDWLANREQEQKAAAFNRETATTNANILNQTDQFNAQMMANAGERAAQMRYNAELEKLNQNNAYRAGLLGNIGSMMTGLYNAYREGQNRNERDLLAASGVFGETNGLLDEYYGINKVDPKTGLIKRGPDAGKYWYNGSAHSQPSMAISAKGGKLKRKNKRKGFTF